MKYFVRASSGIEYEIQLKENADGSFELVSEGQSYHCDLREIRHKHLFSVLINQCSHDLTLERKEEELQLSMDGRVFDFTVLDATEKALEQAGGQRAKKKNPPVIKADMPGVVVEVIVKEGQEVAKGEILLVIEAMKMQNEILAPAAGRVKRVGVQAEQLLSDGDEMIHMDYA